MLGLPGWPHGLELICSRPGRFGYWGGYDPTSIFVDCFFDLCEDRSPECGQGSVAWLRVGLDRGSGSGVRVQNLISGPRPAKLERQSELLFVRNSRREPILCPNRTVWRTVGVRNNEQNSNNLN